MNRYDDKILPQSFYISKFTDTITFAEAIVF